MQSATPPPISVAWDQTMAINQAVVCSGVSHPAHCDRNADGSDKNWQQPFALGAFVDNQWTRVQLASVGIDHCDQEDCSAYALHRCRILQWLLPPASDYPAWTLVSRQTGKYMIHYYTRQIPKEATIPQILYIGDILLLKLNSCGNVADMMTHDITWIKENLVTML